MNTLPQRLCAWSGIACVVIFMIGFFGFAGFVPPPSPSADAAEIGDLFRTESNGIRVGMVLSVIAAGLTGPWVAAITDQLRRIEGWSVLVLLQFGMGILLVLEFILFCTFWQVAAFRTERSDELIQLVNDLSWIPFIGLTSTAIIQAFAIAVLVLRDERERPLIPRWVAYFNVWVGLSFVPGTWNCLFQSGPLAWDGLVAFYIAMVAFLTWFSVNTYAVLTALKRTDDVAADGSGEGSEAGRPAERDADYAALARQIAELREDLARSKVSA